MLADNSIPVSAPAGPKILNPLDANIAAINDDQIAVISPCTGLAPLAIAREIDNGIVTIATTSPDFRFDFKLEKMSLRFQFMVYMKKVKQVSPIAFCEENSRLFTKKTRVNIGSSRRLTNYCMCTMISDLTKYDKRYSYCRCR